MGLFDSLWQDVKNVGDFVGLDGHFGYQGTWNTPVGLSAMQLNPRTAEMISNSELPQSNLLAQYNTNNNNMFGGLANWLDNSTSQDWINRANIFKGLATPALGYLQYKNGQEMSDIYKQQLAFNQQQIAKADKKKKQQSLAMQQGFSNSGLATL